MQKSLSSSMPWKSAVFNRGVHYCSTQQHLPGSAKQCILGILFLNQPFRNPTTLNPAQIWRHKAMRCTCCTTEWLPGLKHLKQTAMLRLQTASLFISNLVCEVSIVDAISSTAAATACVASCLSHMRAQVLYLSVGQTKTQVMQNTAHVFSLDVPSTCRIAFLYLSICVFDICIVELWSGSTYSCLVTGAHKEVTATAA